MRAEGTETLTSLSVQWDPEAHEQELSVFCGLITHPASSYRPQPSFEELRTTLAEIAGTDRFAEATGNEVSARSLPSASIWLRPLRVAFTLWRIRRFRGAPIYSVLPLVLREFFSEARQSGPKKGLTRMLRNRNITASHYSLWNKALSSNCDWVLICEDDVLINTENLKGGLLDVISPSNTPNKPDAPVVIFLSDSFSLRTHGLGVGSVESRVTRGNTTIEEGLGFGWCDSLAATFYSRSFLECLVDYFEQLSEVTLANIPVDWLVDLALIDFFREGPVRTLHLRPGLCSQQSLMS